jgi:hypothetical protein
VTAISRIALDTELRAGVVAVLDVPAWRQAHNITLMTERDAPLTPPAAAFVDVLRCTTRRFSPTHRTAERAG